jgi:heme/copper-type cytochrome/quinol oxidase subunit 2
MSLLVDLGQVLAAEHEELAPLIMPPLLFAAIAVTVFIVLGFVTWSFRDVANRHSNKTSKAPSHGPGH